MASPNGLFQAFIELTVNDVELEFIATVNISQNGSASTPVNNISGNQTNKGIRAGQISWNISIEIPLSVIRSASLDVNDLDISANNSIILSGARPSIPNNDDLEFSGDKWVFSRVSPDTANYGIQTDSEIRQTINLHARKFEFIPVNPTTQV